MTTNTAETILETLRARRSVGKVKPDPLPRALVERVIAAATGAPNHHRTQPWRFVVVTGPAREALGEAMAASLRSRLDEPNPERTAVLVEKERNKPLRAPVVAAVAAVPSRDPKVVEIEEIAAVAAGVRNMLLADADSHSQARVDARRALSRIPNVGPAVAGDLLRLGVTDLKALTGQDPDALYERLCRLDGIRHDPCMRDVFTAIVAYANGEPAQPWWVFSRQRKARERNQPDSGDRS